VLSSCVPMSTPPSHIQHARPGLPGHLLYQSVLQAHTTPIQQTLTAVTFYTPLLTFFETPEDWLICSYKFKIYFLYRIGQKGKKNSHVINESAWIRILVWNSLTTWIIQLYIVLRSRENCIESDQFLFLFYLTLYLLYLLYITTFEQINLYMFELILLCFTWPWLHPVETCCDKI
jgi:hypothetical protein